uniref:Chemokine interleukin-8-like domain-containing protein n=1 Tax=Electrophorus electricus TaxID=8005 RepID=A0AAY5EYF7_ELEEL
MSAIRLLLLSAVVLLSTVTLTEGMRYGTGPRTCCFDFIDKSIKLNNVRSYKLTRQQCNKEAVLLITAQHPAKHTGEFTVDIIHHTDLTSLEVN